MSFPVITMLTGTAIYTLSDRITSIRNLAADVHAETITSEEIRIIATKKDSDVFKLTDNYTWTETDAEFPLVIDASNCLTAVELLRGFGDSQSLTEADALDLKAIGLIETINGMSETGVIAAIEQTTGIGDENKLGTFN